MKRFILILLFLGINSLAQSFPIVVKHNNASNISVRTGPSTSYSIITSIATNKKMVAISESGGWYKINIPTDNISIPTFGWVKAGSGYFQEVSSSDYIELTGNDVMIRKNAGGGSTSTSVVWINNGTSHEYATTTIGQYFAVTNSATVSGTVWHKINITNNCNTFNGSYYSSTTSGWISGNYTNLHNSGGSLSSADLAVYSIEIDTSNAIVGQEIDLETEITNIGESAITSTVNILYTINGEVVGDDSLNASELPLYQGDIEFEQENNYVFSTPGTYNYCVIIEDHAQEENFTNNTMCMSIVVHAASSCDGVEISQQPINQYVSTGNSASFSVNTTGTAPFTYQWKKDGYNISGATDSTYTILELTASNDVILQIAMEVIVF